MVDFANIITMSKQEIISSLVIPILLTILTSVITTVVSVIRIHYLNLREKNRYVSLLKVNYPSVEAVINIVKQFKRISQIYAVYILTLGVFLGGLFPILLLFAIARLKYINEFLNKYIFLNNISNVGLWCYMVFFLIIFPVLIYSFVYLVCYRLFKSYFYLTENEDSLCKLKWSQILSYLSFWLLVGLMSGPYILGIFIFFLALRTPNLVLQNIRWTSEDKLALILTIIIFLQTIFLNLNILFDLKKKIEQFPKKVIDPIINHYQFNFPYLMIKTDSEEFKGKLKDFQNKFLVTLSEENILHFVSWDKIEIMKVIDENKSECTVHDEPKKKKSINLKLVAGTFILFTLLVGLCIIYVANGSYNETNDLLESGKYADALKASNKTIAIDPNNAESWNSKGRALEGLARYDEAVQAYDKAITINPNNAIYYSNKAIVLNNLGKYDEALQVSNKSIEINPNNAESWNAKGNALYGLARYDEALQAYDKAIAINPNSAIYYTNKANVLNILSKYDEVLKASNKSIEIDPNYADGWNAKGNALYGLARYDEALQAYDKAIAINPNSAIYYTNKANVLNILSKYDEALQASNKSIEINPNYAYAWNQKGNILYNLNQLEEAIQAYDKAIQINPKYFEAWKNKGDALDNLGKHDEAIKAFDKVLEINPQYSDAWDLKGFSFYELDMYEEAIKAYDKALELNPQNANALYNRACMYSLMSDKEKAIFYLKKAIGLDSSYKEKAKNDKDFKGLWTNEQFKEIVK